MPEQKRQAQRSIYGFFTENRPILLEAMETRKATVRIASAFAHQPYRILAQNAPMLWSEGEDFRIRLTQQDINIDLAEKLLSHQAPIVYADDLLEIVEVDGRTTIDLDSMRNVPTAVPAFDQMFVEVNMRPLVERSLASKGLRSIAGYVVSDPFPKNESDQLRRLLLMHAKKLRIDEHADNIKSTEMRESIDKALLQLKQAVRIPKCIFRSGLIAEESETIIETGRFVAIYPYVLIDDPYKPGEFQCVGPIGMVIYVVDPDKGIVKLKDGRTWTLWLDPLQSEEETMYLESNASFFDDCANTAASTSLLVMAMLNCSNVELVNVGKTNQDVSKKVAKKGNLKSLRYHELRVRVGNEMMPVYGRKGQTGERGLSIVRGHFRDYSKGKGLFGRYKKSSVWVPPHARGDAMNGIIMKDYRLEPSSKNDE